MATKKTEITSTIVQEIGILSEAANGYKKEINLVSWNGSNPKYDIRDWSSDHQKISKGITLTKDELIALKDVLNKMEI